MKQKLTDAIVRRLPGPDSQNSKTRCRVFYDVEVSGFGAQINASGGRSFILNYSFRGRERRMTIGSAKDWRVTSARVEAKRLRRLIDLGTDPMAEFDALRGAPTLNDLCERYIEEHLPKKRKNAADDDKSMIKRDILPALKYRRVSAITRHENFLRCRSTAASGSDTRQSAICRLVAGTKRHQANRHLGNIRSPEFGFHPG
jgi:hypothetical protein